MNTPLILRSGQGSTRYKCFVDHIDAPKGSEGKLLVTDLGCKEAQEYCHSEQISWGDDYTVWMEPMR